MRVTFDLVLSRGFCEARGGNVLDDGWSGWLCVVDRICVVGVSVKQWRAKFPIRVSLGDWSPSGGGDRRVVLCDVCEDLVVICCRAKAR